MLEEMVNDGGNYKCRTRLMHNNCMYMLTNERCRRKKEASKVIQTTKHSNTCIYVYIVRVHIPH